ncbi:hypothetical protein OMP38_03055 [Cohnella ginsengisoli]|uniref:Uncharacterized protein n=1 Tax=Cohnella ginsengisoli TaxID=425004 RepID=A0A9X4KDC1_9BACL|nr:hypothetical protein [Cohnella ginsengisoli]MDG0789941.1 hypothetical protein [Cohnella ginsengisoli]
MSIKEKMLFAINPTAYLICKGAEKATEIVMELAQNGTIQELREESIRQEIIAKMRASQAKVAQELINMCFATNRSIR